MSGTFLYLGAFSVKRRLVGEYISLHYYAVRRDSLACTQIYGISYNKLTHGQCYQLLSRITRHSAVTACCSSFKNALSLPYSDSVDTKGGEKQRDCNAQRLVNIGIFNCNENIQCERRKQNFIIGSPNADRYCLKNVLRGRFVKLLSPCCRLSCSASFERIP